MKKATKWRSFWKSLHKGPHPGALGPDLHHSEIINLCCPKTARLWSFVMTGNEYSH